MTNNIKIGQIGEDLACQYLTNNGFNVLQRNARYPWGEIDIICHAKDKTLVFVEVKALKMFHANVKHSNTDSGLKPEDNLSQSKLNKVKRTAYLYANNHPELISDEMGWRIDLIAIEIFHSNPETLNQKELVEFSTIRHYENI